MKKSSTTNVRIHYLVLSLAIITAATAANAIFYADSGIDGKLSITGNITQYLLLLAPLYVAPLVFFWLRKQGQKSSGSEVTSTLITAASLTISSVIAQLWLIPLFAEQTPSAIGTLAWFTVLDFVVAFLLSLLASSIAKKIYLSKHSIVV